MRVSVIGAIISVFISSTASASVFQIDVVGSSNGWKLWSESGYVFDVSDGKVPTAGFLGSGWELGFDSSTELAGSAKSLLIPIEVLDLSTGQAFFDPAGFNGMGSFFGCGGLLLPLCVGSTQNFFPKPAFDTLTDTFAGEVSWSMGGSYTKATQHGLVWMGELIDFIGIGGSVRVGDILHFGSANGTFNFSATFTSANVSVVPLPATFAPLLASVGSLGAVAVVRRRRKRACGGVPEQAKRN